MYFWKKLKDFLLANDLDTLPNGLSARFPAILEEIKQDVTIPEAAKPYLIQAWTKLLEDSSTPVAIQALWDGDTQGWGLYMEAVYKDQSSYRTLMLVWLRFGGDIRLFSGSIPPWPESRVGQLIGEHILTKLRIPFYFPSPNKPDDDCPNWWEQHKGLSCADCGKLFIPPDSEYCSKEVCYHCQINREFNEKIKHDIPTGDTASIIGMKAEQNIEISFCSLEYCVLLYWWMELHAQQNISFPTDDIIPIKDIQLIELLDFLKRKVSDYLPLYRPPQMEKRREDFLRKGGHFSTLTYQNLTYEFCRFGSLYTDEMQVLESLIHWINILENIVKEEKWLTIILKRNLTYRDDAFICYIRSSQESVTVSSLHIHFGSVVPAHEIDRTLQKLVQMEYLTLENGTLKTTFKGQHMF